MIRTIDHWSIRILLTRDTLHIAASAVIVSISPTCDYFDCVSVSDMTTNRNYRVNPVTRHFTWDGACDAFAVSLDDIWSVDFAVEVAAFRARGLFHGGFD